MATMKKALRTLLGRLSLVDKRFEISNFDLRMDLAKVVDLILMFTDSDLC